MKSLVLTLVASLTLTLTLSFTLACTDAPASDAKPAAPTAPTAPADTHGAAPMTATATATAPAAACEHGVAKDICARCNPALKPAFVAKNDWCGEHARPESQCVICHPDLAKQGIK